MRKVLSIVLTFLTVMLGTIGIVVTTATTGVLWLSMVCLSWVVVIPAIEFWVEVYSDLFKKKSNNEL